MKQFVIKKKSVWGSRYVNKRCEACCRVCPGISSPCETAWDTERSEAG